MSLITLAILLFFSRDSLIDQLTTWVHLNTVEAEKLSLRLNPTAIWILRILAFIASLIGWKIVVRTKSISGYVLAVTDWIRAVKCQILEIDRLYLYSALAVVGLSFAFNLYNVIVRPIFYDESWTYLNFTRPGFLTAISYYPLPNNHIFHSILTVLTRDLPFGTTVNLRLPSLLISSVTALTFAYTSYRLFSKRTALLLLPLFCFLFPISYYSYLSRGYMLVVLAFVICHYAVMRLVNESVPDTNRRKYSLMLAAGGVLGLYTMPSFIYPLFCCISFVVAWLFFKKSPRASLHFIGLNLLGGLTVLGLYSPVLFRSGLNSLINNEMVQPISRVEVWSSLGDHFSETTEFLFGIPLAVLLFLSVVMLVVLIRKQPPALFWIYCLLMPPVLLMLHGVIPFPRTWIYLVIIVLSVLGQFIYRYEDRFRLSHASITVFGSLLIALFVFQFARKIQWQELFSYQAEEVAEILIDQQADRVYVNHPLAETNLRYIFLERNVPTEIEYSRQTLNEIEFKRALNCCDWVLLEEVVEDGVEWRFFTGGDYPMVLCKVSTAGH